MRYIVRTRGEIIDSHEKVYSVNAKNKGEAELLARRRFSDDFAVYNNSIQSSASRVSFQLWFSMIAMLAAVLLSFLEWKTGHKTVSLKPTFLSCLYAAGLYLAYVVRFRGMKNMFNTWTDNVFLFLMILLFSSIIQIVFVTNSVKFLFWEIPAGATTILFITVLLSWLGLKLMSVVGALFIICLAIGNISLVSSAMGNVFGTVYLLCAVASLLLYAASDPYFRLGMLEFGHSVFRTADSFHSDFIDSKDFMIEKGAEAIRIVKDNIKGDKE